MNVLRILDSWDIHSHYWSASPCTLGHQLVDHDEKRIDAAWNVFWETFQKLMQAVICTDTCNVDVNSGIHALQDVDPG